MQNSVVTTHTLTGWNFSVLLSLQSKIHVRLRYPPRSGRDEKGIEFPRQVHFFFQFFRPFEGSTRRKMLSGWFGNAPEKPKAPAIPSPTSKGEPKLSSTSSNCFFRGLCTNTLSLLLQRITRDCTIVLSRSLLSMPLLLTGGIR